MVEISDSGLERLDFLRMIDKNRFSKNKCDVHKMGIKILVRLSWSRKKPSKSVAAFKTDYFYFEFFLFSRLSSLSVQNFMVS